MPEVQKLKAAYLAQHAAADAKRKAAKLAAQEARAAADQARDAYTDLLLAQRSAVGIIEGALPAGNSLDADTVLPPPVVEEPTTPPVVEEPTPLVVEPVPPPVDGDDPVLPTVEPTDP